MKYDPSKQIVARFVCRVTIIRFPLHILSRFATQERECYLGEVDNASVQLSPIGEIIEDPSKWDTDRENPERQMENP